VQQGKLIECNSL